MRLNGKPLSACIDLQRDAPHFSSGRSGGLGGCADDVLSGVAELAASRRSNFFFWMGFKSELRGTQVGTTC